MSEDATAELNVDAAEAELSSQWAGDELARYLAAAWRNTVHAFTAERDRYRSLAEVDGVFRALLGDAAVNADRIGAAFLMRTHCELLTATSAGLSGQTAQAYSMLPTALETSLQGLYVASDAERTKAWLGRNDDEQGEKQAQEMLADGALRTFLGDLDEATAEAYDKLHARAVNRSSHPNSYADLSRIVGSGQAADLNREYFVCDNDVQRSCLRSIAQTGICCLSIFYYIFGDQYRELGLPDRINKLRHGH